MGRKKGKKSVRQEKEQGAGRHPEEESSQKAEGSAEQQAGPSQPEQEQQKAVECALRSGGADVAAGPSQPPRGQRRRQQPWSQDQQPHQQPPHVAGMERGWQTGQAEHRPGVPLQPPLQAPQALVQRKGPPEVTPPHKAIPRETWEPTPPSAQSPPIMKGVWGQPQQLGRSAGPPFGRGHSRGPQPSQELSLVAPGGRAPRGVTPPPSQVQRSSPAPSEHRPRVPLQPPSQAPQALVPRKGPPEVTTPHKAISRETGEPAPPSSQPPPIMKGAWGHPQQLGRSAGPPFGRGGPRGPPPSQELSLVPSGGRAPRGVTPSPHQAQRSSPAPSGTVKKTAEDAGVASVTKEITTLQIPRRKDCGTKGRRTWMETNYLSLNVSKLRGKIAYHYDVEFQPPLPKRLLRYAMEEFRKEHFPDRHPAFDGRKNLYASQKLPEVSDTVKVYDEESDRDKEFKVTVKYATQIDMESLVLYMERGSSVVPPQNAVQALDVVLRSARMSRGFVQVGRSFFAPPSGHIVDLGDGLEMWYGVFQSAVLGWKPFLNIDVAHKGFPREQNVVDAINEICRPQAGNELTCRQKEDFLQFIRDLKVDYVLPDNRSSKRTYRVNDIAECPAKLRFTYENQLITVQEYFTHVKGVTLQYPHLPCLHVGSLNRENPIYLPPELCTVSRSQVINKKMNEKQTSNMIRSAATSTDIRKQKIMDVLRAVSFNDDPCIREFGISVGGQFEKVEARILDAPRLEYGNRKFADPDHGVWRPSNFVTSSTLEAWIILNLDGYVEEGVLRNFVERMQEMGRTLGMEILPPLRSRTMRRPSRAELESFFSSMKSEVDLVVVVIPDKGSYVNVKQAAELTAGVLTQCIRSATIKNLKMAMCSNILLKVNSKLNGVNHILASVSKPPCLESPAMIVGADVTHPPPDQKNKPSVAAVCASNDPTAFRYNTQIRLQPPRVEIIQDMEAIMKEQLLYFHRTACQKPGRIIFYRDGVSEGQFREVLQSEVNAIRRACASLHPEYKPMVTFLVVQKRHHTRFFPRREDADRRNRNVPPGTVVDKTITHPTELDFFLASHASIQGVSRPAKYHMLWNDDDKMTTDELEQLTYYLCHMFSRCTRSVSYPAPTYNAHLAAYRAGVYLTGQPAINLENLENEQRRYFERAVLQDIIKNRPMYFV